MGRGPTSPRPVVQDGVGQMRRLVSSADSNRGDSCGTGRSAPQAELAAAWQGEALAGAPTTESIFRAAPAAQRWKILN